MIEFAEQLLLAWCRMCFCDHLRGSALAENVIRTAPDRCFRAGRFVGRRRA